MKKYIQLLILSTCTLLMACQNKQKNVETSSSELLGEVSLADLKSEAHYSWFLESYQAHQLDNQFLEPLSLALQSNSTHMVVVLGSWCSDSEILVPALYRVLDAIGYDQQKLKLYAINEEKTEPADIIKSFHIQFVPTIIVYNNDVELGRIMETPEKSLEADLLWMLIQ